MNFTIKALHKLVVELLPVEVKAFNFHKDSKYVSRNLRNFLQSYEFLELKYLKFVMKPEGCYKYSSAVSHHMCVFYKLTRKSNVR